jgi:hypothetical protein
MFGEMLRGFMSKLSTAQAETGAQRHALVNAAGEVVDVVMIDPGLPAEQQWVPPEGLTVVRSDEGGIGWRHEGGQLVDPTPPPPPAPPPIAPPRPGEGMTIV